ncbi:tetraacyldisaccharide 4'-kinase [Duganella sp. BJB488]|uniref:tetraacyldisaccharide 4'-kinase n=1 Tax=unclassified Duganella TaxID=2636909 RepID=UPI000E34AAA1|nr:MULTISPECIES: tetraacyldisaccharide 4'-kinase [unclassified Duganella]RFP12426.1 tetraacyldisaccharide 4'-kinase [Duganella sp. BJB489]RFP16482.1 tetraacyldisaccharide 4'-kinase [Duganella sp. BJB488]RFP30790.1 tetraacyldisaccharide 4'-kinase [Duganella sp. BJB480]
MSTSPTKSSALEATLTRNWLRRGPLACALWPVSLLFRALSGLRAALFRVGVLKSSRLPVPVVVVGNIYIGGTGKTPLTIWLVQALQAAGMTPGVISRGHGGDGGSVREVSAASTPAQVGDEPLLIKQRTGCPVMVGRDRAATGRALLAAHPGVDILLTDDGLQHYALQRDVEIILFDGRGAGNGWLLPAGPLREPVSRWRDFTVVNTPVLTDELARSVGAAGAAPIQMTLAGAHAEQLRDRGQRRTFAELAEASNRAGLRVAAAAGIGNPARFFGMLKAAGLRITELPLPDHHDFQDRPFDALDADLILMTEKDAVKCAQIEELRDDPRLWVVPVTAHLDGALADQIVEKCRGRSIA